MAKNGSANLSFFDEDHIEPIRIPYIKYKIY
jgi:hypothetical protein